MQQIIDFFMIDNFNLLEMLVWCFCSGALVFFSFISALKHEKKKRDWRNIHPDELQHWFSSKDMKKNLPEKADTDETLDDLDVLDL